MKKQLFIIVALFTGVWLNAQESPWSIGPKIFWGDAGFDYETYHQSGSVIQAGFYTQYHLHNRSYLRFGLYYSKADGQGEASTPDINIPGGFTIYGDHSQIMVNHEDILIPMEFLFRFKKSNYSGMFMYAGPTIGLAVNHQVNKRANTSGIGWTLTSWKPNSSILNVYYTLGVGYTLNVGKSAGLNLELSGGSNLSTFFHYLSLLNNNSSHSKSNNSVNWIGIGLHLNGAL